MKIITCLSNTKQMGYVHDLVASCNYFGLELVTLQTEKWSTHRQKDELFQRYLQTQNPEELVFFSDAYDTIFTNTEAEILEKYAMLSKPGKILMSGNRICSPDHKLGRSFKSTTYGYDFPNTGGMIGKVKDFRNILNQVAKTNAVDKSKENMSYRWSNQYLWAKTIIKYPDLVDIDTSCHIFQTMTNQKVLDELQKYKNNEPDLSH